MKRATEEELSQRRRDLCQIHEWGMHEVKAVAIYDGEGYCAEHLKILLPIEGLDNEV